jgi:hypothetical protein
LGSQTFWPTDILANRHFGQQTFGKQAFGQKTFC